MSDIQVLRWVRHISGRIVFDPKWATPHFAGWHRWKGLSRFGILLPSCTDDHVCPGNWALGLRSVRPTDDAHSPVHVVAFFPSCFERRLQPCHSKLELWSMVQLKFLVDRSVATFFFKQKVWIWIQCHAEREEMVQIYQELAKMHGRCGYSVPLNFWCT